MKWIWAPIAALLMALGVMMPPNEVHRDTLLGEMTTAQQTIFIDRIQRHEGYYVKGSRAERNNNPGNIISSPFTDRHGSIGSDGRFAIFPDYATGRKALHTLLFKTRVYPTLTVEAAIARYAPSIENNVEAYIRSVTD